MSGHIHLWCSWWWCRVKNQSNLLKPISFIFLACVPLLLGRIFWKDCWRSSWGHKCQLRTEPPSGEELPVHCFLCGNDHRSSHECCRWNPSAAPITIHRAQDRLVNWRQPFVIWAQGSYFALRLIHNSAQRGMKFWLIQSILSLRKHW